ncbi:hypothetical protein GJV52_00730 [Neisseria brasiliensis]|uniref:putative holin n=1 Tax=Neisseria TaxID=482 RepID=UPI000C27ABAA|nr:MULTISPECIES: putative holin [Neisseria]PJO78751.1 hypothetical protein CWC45_03200 [Neisseria sp. N177_16]QGL24203.1 hypothetical protein GJV52_00730 [Neisseria brasiliensis]
MTDSQISTAINTALIIVGSYHLPASVAMGAIVGASLFILTREQHSIISKAWLFAVSFLSGIFGGNGAAEIVNWAIPSAIPLHLNEFTGAALFSALIVVVCTRLINLAETGRISFGRFGCKPEAAPSKEEANE